MRKDFIERQLTPEVMAAALEALVQLAEAVVEIEELRKQLAELRGQESPDLIDE